VAPGAARQTSDSGRSITGRSLWALSASMIVGGETNQWFPDLVYDITGSILRAAGYHLTEA